MAVAKYLWIKSAKSDMISPLSNIGLHAVSQSWNGAAWLPLPTAIKAHKNDKGRALILGPK